MVFAAVLVFGFKVSFLFPLRGQGVVSPELLNRTARGISGQFLALAKPYMRSARPALAVASDPRFVRLEPNVLAISAERICQAIWRELDCSEPWEGKVYLRLRAADTADDVPVVSRERFKNTWQYAVDLPEVVERWRYVRAITHVVLLEYANRGGASRSAELPTWLLEAVCTHLMLKSEHELVLGTPEIFRNGAPARSPIVDHRREDPLKTAQLALSQRPAATFNEISWPDFSKLSHFEMKQYRLSAMVFFSELRRFQDGPGCLRSFLRELPNYHNWQMAFLKAFDRHFARLLDVEKWWALQAAHYEGREVGEVWPIGESLRQLQKTLSVAVEIYATSNSLPSNSVISLETVVREWTGIDQKQVLERKLAEIEMLRIRLAPELAPTLDGYFRTIRAFLVSKERIRALKPYQAEADYRKLLIDTSRQLRRLDEMRGRYEVPPSS